MKLLSHSILLIIFLFFNFANAAVYKCKNESGKTTYQSKPCAKSDSESLLKIASSPVSNNNEKSPTKNIGPAGSWVNKKNMTANLTASGGFRMTDISGVSLMGEWKLKNSSYSLKAKFHGSDFPVSMNYDSKSDTLFLSKPGQPSAMVKYERHRRL